MTSQKTLLEHYTALDSAAVSDALDALDLPPGQAGFLPVWGTPKIVGFAVTVQLEPYIPGPSGAHIGATAVADANSSNVIVVANEGRTDVSCWGGLLSLGASLNGVRGVVADGACRDVHEAREIGFPVFAKGRIPATARGRLQQRSTGEPVQLGGVTVTPGDLVLADETGVVVVPSSHLDEVLERAQGVAAREQAIAADLRAGVALHEAMRDARLAGITEEH
jgi:regulator of RNase E activity RraA